MHFGRLSCFFNAHNPVRHSVEWDGLNYVGTCKSCDCTIRRVRKGAWRRLSESLAKSAGQKI